MAPHQRNVLVTGAGGYIGALVVKAMADDLSGVGRVIATDVRDTAPAHRLAGIDYITADVRDAELEHLLREHQIDTVVHLAAIVSPGKKSSAALEYSVDVEGTRNVLACCVAAGVSRIIVTSSGAAYGYHRDNAPLLGEDSPLRGNPEFAYSRHKLLVEEMLASYRKEHPLLAQLIFRPGTVLGPSASNQITALFEKPVVMGLSGSATPFVFIWDQDVVACIVKGIRGDATGIYNLAGDGVMTLREIADRLGKRYVAVPTSVLGPVLSVLKKVGLTRYGPEQVRFLESRPVLANERLKREFGYVPQLTSRQVFDLYAEAHRA